MCLLPVKIFDEFCHCCLSSMQLQTERDCNTNRFIYQEETLNMLPPTPPPTLHYADHNGNLSRWQPGPDDWHQHLPLLEAGCGEVEAGLLWPLLHLLWSRVSRGQSGDNLINCTWAPPPPAPALWSRDHTLEILNIDIDTFRKLLTTAVHPLFITCKLLMVEATCGETSSSQVGTICFNLWNSKIFS